MAGLRSFRTTRLPDVAALGLLVAIPLVLFWRTISGKLVVAGYDLILYSYPYRVATARAFAHGQFPFWNPDLFGGVPFLANIQAAVLYPFNFLFIWPGGPQLLSWSIIVHLMLAGIFFYAFGRKALSLSPAAAALGAVAFSASGFAIAQSEHLNEMNALPWVPALLFALDRAYVTRRSVWSAAIAIVLAVQIFAGHPQDTYFGVLLMIVWAIVLVLRREGVAMGVRLKPLISPLVGLLAGLLIAAVQLIPTFELTRYSYRSGGLPWAEATAFSLPGHGLLGNLLPDYTSAVYTEYAGYIGLVATVLAIFAIVRGWRDPAVAVLGIAAVLALLFALGRLTPVFWLAYHLLPGVASFRVPARALIVSTFAGSALAGSGVMEIQRLLRERQLKVAFVPVVIAGALLVMEALAFAVQRVRPNLFLLKVFPSPIPTRQLLAWLLVVIVMSAALVLARHRPGLVGTTLLGLASVEMVLAAQPLNPLHALPASIYQTSSALDAVLPSDASQYRSLSLAGLTDHQLNGGLSDPRFRAYTARRSIDQPDFSLQAGRPTIDGYDGGLLPLASYVRFRSLLLPPGTANVPDYPLIVLTDQVFRPTLLGLLGVGRILVQASPTAPPMAPISQVGSVLVLQNGYAWQRAFLVHDVRGSQGSADDFALLQSPSFSPDISAIASPSCRATPQSTADKVDLTRNEAGALDLSVASDSLGLLVISNVAYPGWHATVDGHSTPVVQVDDLLQGVCLPAGAHIVRLRFTPTAWPLAVATSLLGLLLAIYLVISTWIQRRAHS